MSQKVINRIIRIGDRRGERKRYKRIALAISNVESHHENLPGGDADSYGFRQQRESIYGRQPLRKQINNLYNELHQLDHGQSPGELAADVQRPAAQYRGRYREVLRGGEPDQLLASHGGDAPGANRRVSLPGRVSERSTFDQAGFAQASRRSKVAAYLQQQGRGNSVLFRSGLLSTETPDASDFTNTELVRGKPTTLNVPGSSQPAKGAVRSAITAARAKLGVHEINGSNRSKEVDEMSRSFGMVGVPWCGIFVGTVLKEAGVKGINSRVASVAAIEQDAKAGANGFGSWHSPRHARKGDALVTRQGGHVVFVTSVDRRRGLIKTIGGNTSNGSVRRVTYRMDEVHGAARPRYRR